MKTHEQFHQPQDHNPAELNTKPAPDAAYKLVDDIVRLVAQYKSQERSSAVREGLARRHERLRRTAEKETK